MVDELARMVPITSWTRNELPTGGPWLSASESNSLSKWAFFAAVQGVI